MERSVDTSTTTTTTTKQILTHTALKLSHAISNGMVIYI